MSDELTGIFDNITPDDFTPYKGASSFDKFVRENIQTTKISWLAAEGNINPVAVMSNASECETFAPTDDETLGEYIARLRKAAKAMGATWFYFSRKTLVGSYRTANEGDIPDIADPAHTLAHEDRLIEGVFYYAERHENGAREVRHGIMQPEGERLGDMIEGDARYQKIDLLDRMLG